MSTILAFFISLVSVSPSGDKAHPENYLLAGDWLMQTSFGRAVMSFEVDDDGQFSAYTRKNAARQIVGFWTSTAARAFTPNFKKGSLLYIRKGEVRQDGDCFTIQGTFVSPLGQFLCDGALEGDSLTLYLCNDKGKMWDTMTGTRQNIQTPLSDYGLILDRIRQITSENIYNRQVLDSPGFRQFERRMRRVAGKCQDDVEMIFAFYRYCEKLPFSHYGLIRVEPESTEDNSAEDQTAYLILEEKRPNTVYLRIKSFEGTAQEMDSVFSIIKARGYQNLIVDLRYNSGGNIEPALKFAAIIADTAFYGGIFLTQKWFDNHFVPPPVDQYPEFPRFSEANVELLLDGIHNQEGICLRVIPEEEPYQGKIFILVNRYTGSTCEPLVYGARQNGLATIVGETTAGAMLNAEMFELPDGFQLFLPTAEYYASDGYRIDMKGVEPDIKTDAGKAMTYVLENLIE